MTGTRAFAIEFPRYFAHLQILFRFNVPDGA